MIFGKWEYNRVAFTLTHLAEDYEIDLDEVTNSAELLDWLCQVQGKSWCTKKDLWTLFEAFDYLFKPQQNLCPFGRGYYIDPRQVAGVPSK